MFRASILAVLSLVAFTVAPASADSSSNEQVKAAALKLKQASTSSSSKALVSRTGSLVYNITINRKAGAATGPFYCNANAFHWGVCMITDPSDGTCVEWYSYDLHREVQATPVSATQYTCSVKLNYNFPKADSADYIWPTVEVYQRSAASTTSYPADNGYSWRSLAPVILPSTASTTFTVSIDQ